MGYVRGESPGQSSLFPPTLDDLVSAENPVRVIEAYVGSLDLVQLGFERAVPEAMGRPGYDPADLLKLYLYGYLNRVRSSRRLERECHRNVEVMWLLGKLAPDFKTIAEFRRVNGQAFVLVCRAFVRFCSEADLIGGELVAIDGSKFQAVSSRRRVITPKSLDAENRKLQARIEQYLESLDQADRDEPSEPVDRKALEAALRKLRARQANGETAKHLLEELGERQCVVGENDARLMRSGHRHSVAYNVQSAVDAKHGLIVHHEVTNDGTDSRQLEPVAKGAQQALGGKTLKVVADTGYSSATEFAACERAGITPYVPPLRRYKASDTAGMLTPEHFQYDAQNDRYRCPAGKMLVFSSINRRAKTRIYVAKPTDCGGCLHKERCTRSTFRVLNRHVDEEAFTRMRERLAAAPQILKQRRCLAEHPFAQIKTEVLGNGRFLLRGLSGTRAEMALAVLARNFKRVMNILGNRRLIERLAPA